VCSDTVAALERRLDEQIASFVAEDQQAQLRQDLKSRPLSMLAPCTNGQSALRIDAGDDRQLQIQNAYARRDARKLNALLSAVAIDMRTQRVGDMSLDYSYELAWVKAASGDTLGAVTQLDRVLGALPAFGPRSLREPAAAAAAGRAMILRADLAAAAGDALTAKRWAGAVSSLWASADTPLQPEVRRMRALAAASR
jgi:hypothetical protein